MTAEEKGKQLAWVLGNLAVHIHELGLRKQDGTIYGEWGYRNDRAESERDQLLEAVVIACRSGKFSDPKRAAEKIIKSLTKQAAEDRNVGH